MRLKTKLMSNIRISETCCWEWQRARTQDGYGIVSKRKNENVYAHRLAYEIFVGDIPAGYHILHSCDNPCCCNPKHLRVGTNYDNVQDRQNKNRQAKGITHGRHKFTENEVVEIRQLYSTGNFTQQELSVIFNASRSHICNILNNKYWKHL